jgi:hypothetical protein
MISGLISLYINVFASGPEGNIDRTQSAATILRDAEIATMFYAMENLQA